LGGEFRLIFADHPLLRESDVHGREG